MTAFFARRVAVSLLLLLVLLTVLFFLLHLAPGDPTTVLVHPNAPRQQRELLIELYGLDRPLGVQYLSWLSAVLRGDWGSSYTYQRPVMRVIGDALPATLRLAAAAILIEYLLAVAIGFASVRWRDRSPDHLLRIGSLLLFSLPAFWLGQVAILLFANVWPLLPAGHMRSVDFDQLALVPRLADAATHLALPALVLGVTGAGTTARVLRNSLLETLGESYVVTARAKGLSETRVLLVHALRNAAGPLIHMFGITLPLMLNGAVVVEVVFSWPGLGRTVMAAIQAHDYPVVLAATALSGALVLAGSLAADLAHAWIDPRVRHG